MPIKFDEISPECMTNLKANGRIASLLSGQQRRKRNHLYQLVAHQTPPGRTIPAGSSKRAAFAGISGAG